MKRIQLENRNDLKSEIPLNTPYVIFVDPSSYCNFACRFCMNSKIQDREIMRPALFYRIIDSLQDFEKPIKVLRLYGFGEPLMHKHFEWLVAHAKRSKKILSVDTTTNASLLTPARSERIITSGIDRINISIEGMNDTHYKEFAQTKIPIFQKIIDNVAHLYLISRNKTIIFVKINGDYLLDEEKEQFTHIFSQISDGIDIEHTMNCWYDIQVENVNKEVGIYGQELQDVKVCPYIFYSIMIHADGIVSKCFLDWNKKMIVGNANKESIEKIWNGPAMYEARVRMLEGDPPEICKQCQQLKAGMPVDLDHDKDELLRRFK